MFKLGGKKAPNAEIIGSYSIVAFQCQSDAELVESESHAWAGCVNTKGRLIINDLNWFKQAGMVKQA